MILFVLLLVAALIVLVGVRVLLCAGQPSLVVCCGCFLYINFVAASGVGFVVCCYLVFVSCNVLNTGLCAAMLVSFICRLF
jgi:hypothetical protein